MTYWILVASAARARLFSWTTEKLDVLKEERQIEYPRGRAKGRDILADAPGRYTKTKGGRGGPRSAMELDTDPHLVEEQRFAHHLADMLNKAQALREFDYLALCAPPQFLGLLRDSLAPVAEKRVVASAAKDLINLDSRELTEHLLKIFLPSIKQLTV